ncbi:hypothetical protein ACHAAC_17130 [Aeromicrobium sp. CF4.19]|uniref:hypothetical protein n=1 Tax=Aeromicrobium sp. CF4.19 TaxID=3373082 RepID=UPI003EE5F772
MAGAVRVDFVSLGRDLIGLGLQPALRLIIGIRRRYLRHGRRTNGGLLGTVDNGREPRRREIAVPLLPARR